MPSKIELINRALSEIGRLPVTAITDSDDAQYMAVKIDELYPEVLLDCMWNNAVIYREDNTPLTDNYSPDYTYTYQLPADFGRFYKIAATGIVIGLYTIVDNLLLTHIRPIKYYYITNQLSFDLITPLMARAIVLYAAAKAAPTLTNNLPLGAYLQKEYETIKNKAVMENDMDRAIMGAPSNDFNRIYYV